MLPSTCIYQYVPPTYLGESTYSLPIFVSSVKPFMEVEEGKRRLNTMHSIKTTLS